MNIALTLKRFLYPSRGLEINIREKLGLKNVSRARRSEFHMS